MVQTCTCLIITELKSKKCIRGCSFFIFVVSSSMSLNVYTLIQLDLVNGFKIYKPNTFVKYYLIFEISNP